MLIRLLFVGVATTAALNLKLDEDEKLENDLDEMSNEMRVNLGAYRDRKIAEREEKRLERENKREERKETKTSKSTIEWVIKLLIN